MPPQTPFSRVEIPWTSTRLKSLIKIYCTFGGYQPDPNDPGALPSLSSLSLVGAVRKVHIKTTRSSVERRELNYDTYAEILEMVPGLASFELTFESVVLYQATFPEAIGFDGFDLKYNTRPTLFALQLPSPNPATLPPVTLMARDCWLNANVLDFDTEAKDDLRIIQEIPMACGGIIKVPGSTTT
jgi:hypothetical protein